ncbi:MAG: DUF177 domain-containing protein [Rhodothalassiaceae bacterium]
MTEWSHVVPLPVRREGIGRWHLIADGAERTALAARFDLIGIDSCVADISITAIEGGVRVTGTVAADIAQRCVVSLEPFASRVETRFSIRFLRELPESEDGEEFIDPEEEEDIELLEEGHLDIGEIAAQSLGLALDPYPRAPGTQMPGGDKGLQDDDPLPGRQRPFAGLKNIRDMT